MRWHGHNAHSKTNEAVSEFPTLSTLDLAQPRDYRKACRDTLISAKKPLSTKDPKPIARSAQNSRIAKSHS